MSTSTRHGEPVDVGRPGIRASAIRAAEAAGAALGQLIGGIGTAMLALAVLFWLAVVAVTSVVGVGLLMAPSRCAPCTPSPSVNATGSPGGVPRSSGPIRHRTGCGSPSSTRPPGGSCAGWPGTARSGCCSA